MDDSPLEGTGFEPPVPQQAFSVVVVPVCIRAPNFALPGNQAEVRDEPLNRSSSDRFCGPSRQTTSLIVQPLPAAMGRAIGAREAGSGAFPSIMTPHCASARPWITQLV